MSVWLSSYVLRFYIWTPHSDLIFFDFSFRPNMFLCNVLGNEKQFSSFILRGCVRGFGFGFDFDFDFGFVR